MHKYKDLDFLEIGTSDFRTLIEEADDNTIGISVEPIKFYLDKLPDPANVEKVNAAISITNTTEDVSLFYIPLHVIKENKLPNWFRGCNSLGCIHPTAVNYKIEHLVEELRVPQIPISTFLEERNIRKIDYFKIDTEGGDTFILEHLYNYLKDKTVEFYPKKIKFESNILTSSKRVDYINDLYLSMGYTVKRLKHDTELML